METLRTRMCFIFFLLLGLAASPSSQTATVVVDGVTEWKHPTVSIGDSVIFRHKYHYNLYIFRSTTAFTLCNFSQATLLTNPISPSYIWRPSRLGYFYFSFDHGTDKPCQKLPIKVIPQPTPTTTPLPLLPAPAPAPSSHPPQAPSSTSQPPHAPSSTATAPAPAPGGDAPSSPGFPWPFLPHEKSAAGSVSYYPPPSAADGKGGSVPFIASNPAVPIPGGEVNSASVLPPFTTATSHAVQLVPLMGLSGAAMAVLMLL